MIYFKLIF